MGFRCVANQYLQRDPRNPVGWALDRFAQPVETQVADAADRQEPVAAAAVCRRIPEGRHGPAVRFVMDNSLWYRPGPVVERRVEQVS